jgi:hypothetical protein
MNVSFDPNTDTLYIRMGKPKKSIARDIGHGVLIQYDSFTREPIGAIIHDFSHRFSEKKQSVQIPFGLTRLQPA